MRRYCGILVGALLLTAGCSPPAAPVDKAEAVRLILAWLTGDGRLPGFEEAYPDAKLMKRDRPIFLVCEFIPPDVAVTDNPNFHRISQAEYDKAFRENDLEEVYRQGGFLRIELVRASDQEVSVVVQNMMNAKAGHRYSLVFRNNGPGLRMSGHLEMVY